MKTLLCCIVFALFVSMASPPVSKTVDVSIAGALSTLAGTTSLSLPNALASIGGSAFANCLGIIGPVTLSSSLTSIGTQAFSNCSGITIINSLNPTPPTLGSSCFYGATSVTDVYVPTDDVVAAYKANHL